MEAPLGHSCIETAGLANTLEGSYDWLYIFWRFYAVFSGSPWPSWSPCGQIGDVRLQFMDNGTMNTGALATAHDRLKTQRPKTFA